MQRSQLARPPLPSLCVLALGLAACAGPEAFTTSFRDNRRSDVAPIVQKLQGAHRAALRPVAVGATRDAQEVFAYDLAAGRMLWKLKASPVSPPQLAGDVVAIHEPGQLRIVRLDNGELILERPDEHLALMGADGDGSLDAIVMSSGGSMGARSRLWLLRDGRVQSELETHYALGAPAVLGGMVFLPWNNVFLSVLDSQGQELARLRIQGDVVSRAVVRDDTVYFGQRNLFRFGRDLAAGDKPASAYFHPQFGKLPGNPAFLPAANLPPPPVQSAVHSVRLAFEPESRQDTLGLAHLYLLFYRQLFSLNEDASQADWVYEHSQDVMGLGQSPQGLLLADIEGNLTLVDDHGQARWSGALGVSPAVVSFRAERFEPALKPAEPQVPLADQLAAAAMNVDARLVPSRTLAVTLLGTVPDATQSLVALCEDTSNPARITEAACSALATRSEGAEGVLTALQRHSNFLTGTSAPPIGPLAEAAAHLHAKAAVPALLAHLRDPATPARALPALMLALDALGDDATLEPVAAFVKLYHADAEDPDLMGALEIGLRLLAKRKGAQAAPILELVANDSMTPPGLAAAAAQALTTLPQPEPSEGASNEGGQAEESQGAAEAEGPGQTAASEPLEARPTHLTARHVEHALSPVMDQLRGCLKRAPKRPRSARLTIVLSGEGRVLLVRSLPENLQACLAPLIESVPFPANRLGRRQQITYRLTL